VFYGAPNIPVKLLQVRVLNSAKSGLAACISLFIASPRVTILRWGR
jgi:hypothetical protein